MCWAALRHRCHSLDAKPDRATGARHSVMDKGVEISNALKPFPVPPQKAGQV